MVAKSAPSQKGGGKKSWAIYTRKTGEYLGTFVARGVEEAVGLAVTYHGYKRVMELARLEIISVADFEVVSTDDFLCV